MHLPRQEWRLLVSFQLVSVVGFWQLTSLPIPFPSHTRLIFFWLCFPDARTIWEPDRGATIPDIPSCPLSYATKLFPKRRRCGKKTPSPNSMLLSTNRRPGIRLSFEYSTTLLSGEGGERRTGTATMFRKMLSKYTIFSTVLSKIVVYKLFVCIFQCPLFCFKSY